MNQSKLVRARFPLPTVAACAALGFSSAHAAVLGIYTMGTNDNGAAIALTSAGTPSSVATGVSLDTLNLTGSAILAANAFTSQSIAGGQPSRILATQTAGTTAALAITNNSYFQFTVTPDVGQTIDLNSISMDTARGGASARGFAISSSADSFATIFASLAGHPATYNPLTGIATQEAVYTNYAFDLGPMSSISIATTFRIYSWSSAAANTVYYDNITLNGTFVPEPSAALFGGIGLLAMLRHRRGV